MLEMGLITHATSAGSSDRAKSLIWGKILDIFWLVQPTIVVEEPHCALEIPP